MSAPARSRPTPPAPASAPASASPGASPGAPPTLARELGTLGLLATGVGSMVGVAINVIPFTLARTVPGIGPWVLPAFAVAALGALLAGLAHASLGSAMPRAGGSYVYATRGLDPYLGFVASVSQWFALSTAIGVVAYMLVPFVRDALAAGGWGAGAALLERPAARLALPLVALWSAAALNLRGVRAYARTMVPLMFVVLAIGLVVIVGGFAHDADDFARALARVGDVVPPAPAAPFDLGRFGTAAALLFSSFIGFEAVAQGGGEARDPGRTVPRATVLAVVLVAAFYLLFVAAVQHTVPWPWIAREAAGRDLTAPGMLGAVLPRGWTVVAVAGAAVALAKDLPPMLLSVSRLMFAWAEDGIAPAAITRVHRRWRTPWVAILASTAVASLCVVGSHLAGDFFLGVDVLVLAMTAGYLLVCATVLTLPRRNPALARAVRVLPGRAAQVTVATLGLLLLGAFLAVHAWRDLTAPAAHWWLRATPVWGVVLLLATLAYAAGVRRLRRAGVDVRARLAALPPA